MNTTELAPLTPPAQNREQVLVGQFNCLLGTLHHLKPFVLQDIREEVDDDDENEMLRDNPQLDGGIACAVTCTVMSVCDRISALCNEDKNWGLGAHAKVEKKTVELFNENLELLKLNEEMLHKTAAPHYTFKPGLGKTPDGRFVAIYGDGKDAIVGAGETLEAALADYDLQWKLKSNQVNRLSEEGQ
jgi:pyruvate/2-oxoacid:ferredoxin oxidoreductase beta subunit